MAEWVKFVELPPAPKTKRWSVNEKEGGGGLGFIAWFGRWRKYAFNPYANTVYEEICLRDIATFCETETKKHREKKHGTAQSP